MYCKHAHRDSIPVAVCTVSSKEYSAHVTLHLPLQIVSDFRSITDTPSTECGSDNPDIVIENVVFDTTQDPASIARPFFVNINLGKACAIIFYAIY